MLYLCEAQISADCMISYHHVMESDGNNLAVGRTNPAAEWHFLKMIGRDLCSCDRVGISEAIKKNQWNKKKLCGEEDSLACTWKSKKKLMELYVCNSFLDPQALVKETHLSSPCFSLASTMETVPKGRGYISVSGGPGKNQRWVLPHPPYSHPTQYEQERRTQFSPCISILFYFLPLFSITCTILQGPEQLPRLPSG